MYASASRWFPTAPERVFQELSTASRLPGWLRPLASVDAVDLGHEGGRWAGTLRLGRRAEPFQGVVHRRVRQTLWLAGASPGGHRTLVQLSTSPWHGGSQVVVSLELDRPGRRARGIREAVAARRLGRELRASLDALGAVLAGRAATADATRPVPVSRSRAAPTVRSRAGAA